AGLLAEQLGEHPAHRRALGQAMAVAAMRARDEVVALQRLADAHGHALLTDIEMGETGHLGALVELVHLLLEGANLGHLTVEMQVRLEVQPRLGHLGRHRASSMGLRGCVSRAAESRTARGSRSAILWPRVAAGPAGNAEGGRDADR